MYCVHSGLQAISLRGDIFNSGANLWAFSHDWEWQGLLVLVDIFCHMLADATLCACVAMFITLPGAKHEWNSPTSNFSAGARQREWVIRVRPWQEHGQIKWWWNQEQMRSAKTRGSLTHPSPKTFALQMRHYAFPMAICFSQNGIVQI